MEYLSASEAAAKWGTSLRQVQRLLAAGRIPSAKKCGNSWVIPADAQKPGDPRFFKNNPSPLPRGQTLPFAPEKSCKTPSFSSELAYIIENTTQPVPLGDFDAMASAVEEEWLRLYIEGAIAWLRCDFESVIQGYRKLAHNDAARLRYTPQAIAAAISAGDDPLYQEIETWCKDLINADMDADITAIAEYTLAVASVGAFVPAMIPGWMKDGDFTALPLPLRREAIVTQVLYLHFLKKYESILDVARTALAYEAPGPGLSYTGVLLHTMSAAACCSLGRLDDAEKYLLEAMKNSLPHGFIAPFVTHMPLFIGLLEPLLAREFPAYQPIVMAQAERVIPHWIAFHNRYTQENITLILTSREYQMARLAAQGVPFKKIAERFRVSLGTVNNNMQAIYAKLFISRKKDLAKYIL